MCGVPYHAMDTYVNRLLQAGHKVAICDQLEDPSQSKGMVKRGVTRVITPGTVTEPSMLSDTDNNYILSISRQEEAAGFCYADVSTGEFIAYEVHGNDTAIQNELSRIAPKELICAPKDEEWVVSLLSDPRLKNTYFNPYLDWAYGLTSAEKVLEDHFKTAGLRAFGIADKTAAIRAAGALMRYLIETQKNSLAHINTIRVPALSNTLVIDPTAARNLEVTQTIIDGNKKGSLLWLLDKTKTSLGARLLKRIVLRPLHNMNEINARCWTRWGRSRTISPSCSPYRKPLPASTTWNACFPAFPTAR